MSFGGGFGGRGGGGSSDIMMVESANVGKIIGRGGSKIRDLEQDSNARIKISRDEDENGMKSVEISGTDEEIDAAKRMIEQCLSQDRDSGRRFGGGGDSETIFVESSEVGRIIGRGGSRIRDMESESGCRIKVSRDGDSQGRSSVELSGNRNQISDAKKMIQEAGVDIMNGDGRGW
ncbi:protein BTR1 isoform X3 [Aplysia californica]|uniref:Protein BTR1 isoform X3 n=1 Tax=Aplysia californica TaxID=6500 RepID=A0ABM0JU47_APLCA|nr:protein BTR1 isoform X3 [Aplysia californica]